MCISILFSGNVYADSYSGDYKTDKPIPEIGTYDEGTSNRRGTLSKAEIQLRLDEASLSPCTECPQPYDFRPAIHSHKITDVFNEYEVNTVSNNYNTGVSLSLGTIEAAVGYQVGTTWSSIAHYEIDVPIGKSGFIQARDIVDVKEFNILTTIVIGDENSVFEHTTGWSSQWKQFRYTGYTF